MNDIFLGLGIPITLHKADDFLKVVETLTRIGIESKQKHTLYQSCHILHKRGQYAILHFKELFKMDGKDANISITDIERRNTIVKLLQDWGLIMINQHDFDALDRLPINQIRILTFKDKNNWTLESKYNIGVKR
jgi:hypothetical protein